MAWQEIQLLFFASIIATTVTEALVTSNGQPADGVDYKGPSFLQIEVAAARNYTYVKLDGRYIHYGEHDHFDRRGLQLLVLHPVTGATMLRRFNPGHSKAGLTDIMQLLERVQTGRIIVLCTQYEASFSLEETTRRYFSTVAPYLSQIGAMSRYAMVARKDGGSFAEGHVRRDVQTETDEPLLVFAAVAIDRRLGRPCTWPDGTRAVQHSTFCDKYEGFGNLCNCSNPDPVERPFRPLLHNRTFPYPIAVLGGDRGTYLYRMLQTLLPNRGLDKTRVTIFLQDYHDHVLELAALLGIRVVVKISDGGEKGNRITRNMKNAIQTSFELFPEADKMIVLEDDLYVSPDFISYFEQTAPLLDEDITLFCISAWNDNSYKHSSQDSTLLYRTSFFPGLGWMMKKSTLMDEMMPNWKAAWDDWDWDMWFRTDEVALYRECIVPDVSRTYHFAYLGGHVYSFMQYQYYSDKSLNTIADVELDLSNMKFSDYIGSIYRMIRDARLPLRKPYYRTCFEMFPPTDDPEERKKPYVVIFKMKHAYNLAGVQNLMTCLGLWDLDVRGEHKGTWRFFINGNAVLAVGVPYSTYSEELMQAIGIAPILDFSKYNLKRQRRPSTEGKNPRVVTFGVPGEEEEYDDDDDEIDEVRAINAHYTTGDSADSATAD